MAVTFDEVSKAQYVLLTTFTKDGRPKPTPIWIARDGDRALVITEKNAWKVKRIRNTPRVTLAICDMRGNVKSETIEAVATVLDESQTETVYQAINRRYGIVGRIFNFFSKLRGGANRTIGLEIRPA
ncbi:MAG: PPOX class F420-dependent oxidoreductase [Mycobacteriaceae bacterium]|nr:PPOX class F420-dependent oxidoreductase [Mycobacteriaceae bacterium]